MGDILPFQILSLSGGGYLGLYTACVLAGIEAQTGRPIADSFDLIAGTSVGGIIALGLSSGRSAADIAKAFIENGDKIFSKRRPPKGIMGVLKVVSGFPSARYSPEPLRNIIEQVVGPTTRMHELRRPTIITSINLTKGGPKVFKTGHHDRFIMDWKMPVVEVAMATSAAPTYFPVHRIGDELFADGGMVANSPDLLAVHEAETFLSASRPEIRVLSIGTTTARFSFSASTRQRLGAIGWLRDERLPNVMIGSQQAITHDMMGHILGDRYVRIDREQSGNQKLELALDCASPAAKRDLQAAASASIAEFAGNTMLRTMLANRAPEFKFANATL